MKLILYFLLILLEYNPGTNADKDLQQLNNAESNNSLEKVSKYLQQVMLNDKAMSKGYVEVLIIDLTLKRDINDLLDKFYEEPGIVVNIIKEIEDIKMNKLDFVLVVQDFLNSNFDVTLYIQIKNDLHNLFLCNFIGRNENFIVLNILETLNDKLFMLELNGYLVQLLVVQKAIFNLMLVDVYGDGTVDLWRPKFITKSMKLNKLTLNQTTFSRSEMGDIHANRVNLVQYDAPPFSYVENRKLIGVEGKLLDVFCYRYNLTYKIINDDTEHYVFDDILRKFQRLRADLSLTTKIQMMSNIWFVDFIFLNIDDGLCMLAPRNVLVSSYENFDYPFDNKISLFLLITSCLVIIIWKGISMAVHSGFSIHFIIFSVFRYLMGNSATGENRMTFKEKFVVYGYVIVAMVLMALYESFLISFMMSEPSYKSVQSFQELNDSNTKIFQYFDKMEHVTFKDELIMNRVNLSNDKLTLTLPKHFDVNMAYITTCEYADAFIRSSRNFNKGNQRLFDKLEEKLTIYAQAYPVSNIFPLKKELKLTISAMRESGLRDFWVRSEVHENLKHDEDDDINVLNLDDMQLAFIILGTGLTSSFLVFLVELIVNNIIERRNNRVIYL